MKSHIISPMPQPYREPYTRVQKLKESLLHSLEPKGGVAMN